MVDFVFELGMLMEHQKNRIQTVNLKLRKKNTLDQRILFYFFFRFYCHVHTHTHTVEYYLVAGKKEILPFITKWMDLEGVMLSQIWKDKYSMISFICGILKKLNSKNRE